MSARAGALLVVATPIGHLGDLTRRAEETLREADRVLAEDTRRTRTLLTHLGITGKRLERLDENASAADVERIVLALEAGERIALVSDAGTPVVSDPGHALVEAAAARKIPVIPVPGPSAVMAAVSVSALVRGPFRFVGFLPRSGDERREAITRIARDSEAAVFFESPARTQATLSDLAAACPERRLMVARELTKVHEELVRGTAAELAAAPREWLGEVTIVVGASDVVATGPDEAVLDARIDEALARGERAKLVAETLAVAFVLPRREVYARVLERKRVRGE